MDTNLQKPTPADLIEFIKNQPYCTTRIINRFLREKFNPNYTGRQTKYLIDRLVEHGFIMRDKQKLILIEKN